MWPTRKVQRWLYELFAYYAIFIGVTSYRYDFDQRRYKNTRWTQLIASVANLCVLLLLVMDLYLSWSEFLPADVVTELTIRFESTLNDVICMLRVLQRVPRERATSRIGQELQRMRRIYHYSWARQELQDRQLERIYLLKSCIVWLLAGFLMGFMLFVYHFLGVPLDSPVLERLLVVLYVLAIDGQDVTMHLYFLFTWRICRRFERLNRRIGQLIGGNAAVDTLELHHLRGQHWQLTALQQRLNVTYNFTTLSYRLSLIVTAAALGYYLSIFRVHHFQITYQVLGIGLCIVFALDGYILDMICDRTMWVHRETSSLLRQQHELVSPDSQLSRGCDLLALQIACFPLKMKPFGLFSNGKATWLSGIALVFSWMFVLLQYRMVLQSRH